MVEKCAIQTIRLSKLEEDTSSPALAALVTDGWEPIGSVVIDDGTQPMLHMILKPPRNLENEYQKANQFLLRLIVFLLSVAIAELSFIVFRLF
jgi:hypothetical protein